ncbi:hypothetical protein MTO96_005763 [Rhipicephalus appendiculatus]
MNMRARRTQEERKKNVERIRARLLVPEGNGVPAASPSSFAYFVAHLSGGGGVAGAAARAPAPALNPLKPESEPVHGRRG